MPSLIDTKIAACASWEEFCVLANSQKNSKEKGDLFERLTQIYLQTHPTYRTKIKHVWWCNNGELPRHIQKKLGLDVLPSEDDDEGIDLICEALTEDLIIKMAKAHHKKTGKYPTESSAWVLEGSDSWASISHALTFGIRGLSGGSSLAKLLEEKGLKRNLSNIIYPSKEEILKAGINFRDNNNQDKFPGKEAGQVVELPSFTWSSLNEAMKRGKIEGIPKKTTLADFWAAEFNQRNQNNLPDFSISEILEWCDLYKKNHNEFPVLTSNPIPEMGQETFRTIDVALIYGRRGLKNSGSKSLSNLLVRERGKKSHLDLPDLDIKKIKIWMLQWYLDHLSWPTAEDGEIPNSGGEKWKNLNASMSRGGRGLEKTSVAKIKSGLINELDDLPTTSENTELEDKVRALLSFYESRI